jgi:hypothetical protein
LDSDLELNHQRPDYRHPFRSKIPNITADSLIGAASGSTGTVPHPSSNGNLRETVTRLYLYLYASSSFSSFVAGQAPPEPDAFNVAQAWHDNSIGWSFAGLRDPGLGSDNAIPYNQHDHPDRLDAAPAPPPQERNYPYPAARRYASDDFRDVTYSQYPASYPTAGPSCYSPPITYPYFESNLHPSTADLVSKLSPAESDFGQGSRYLRTSVYDGGSGSASIDAGSGAGSGGLTEERNASARPTAHAPSSRQTLSQIPGVPLSDRPARLRLVHSVSNFRTSLDSIHTAAHTLSNKSNISHRSSGAPTHLHTTVLEQPGVCFPCRLVAPPNTRPEIYLQLRK